jgi:uncharacterized protein involved in outer membrane biogenesis
MHRNLKLAGFAVSALVGAAIITAAAVAFFVDANAYKSRVEQLASDALHMEITVAGQLDLGIFPRPHITAQDVRVRNRDKDFIVARSVDLGIEFLPLLRGKLRLGHLTLKDALVSIEQDEQGHYNFESTAEEKRTRGPFVLAKAHITNGKLHYTSRRFGDNIILEHCNGKLRGLRHPGGPGFLSKLSLTAQISCKDLKTAKVHATELKFSLAGKDGIYDFKPLALTLFGGKGAGNLHLERSTPVPRLQVQFALSQFRIEEYFKAFHQDTVATGLMDFSMELSMQGKDRLQRLPTADGVASLVGKDLVLAGRNLDEELARFESTQNFSLLDLSAFFFAGPVGLAVTQGYDYSNLFRRAEGNTSIPVLVSKWKVGNGIAHAQDVALATRENRLALRGDLDFVRDEFVDVTVAVVDAQGCPKVLQRIHGPFLKPIAQKPDYLKTLAGPAINLLKKARDLLSNEACVPFYTGTVTAP